MSFQVICLALLLSAQFLLGSDELQFLGGDSNDKPKKDKSIKLQRIAVDKWAQELTPDDYSLEKWPSITGHNQPQHIFDFYAQKISDSFAASKAKVNFVLVGACDGTHDKTIRDRFLPNENWNGVFVEPVSMNFRDLNKFIADNKVESRSITIQAAVTDECKTPTVPMKFAKYEDKDPNLPHWMRREIGSILEKASDVKKLGKMWDVEEIPCKTAAVLMQEWSALEHLRRSGGGKRKQKQRDPRIHVLKIDAEGHDFQVLSSFLHEDIAEEALPLLICFEAKSMHENLPRAREIMVSKGYVVSEGNTNDGFALLKIKPSGKKSKGKRADSADSADKGSTEGYNEEEEEGGDRSGRDEVPVARLRKRKQKRGKRAAAE